MVSIDLRHLRALLISFVAASVLVACGSDSGSTPPTPSTTSVTRVISFGDSLSDVGTYKVGSVAAVGGGRFTTNPGTIWVEAIAAKYGVANVTPNVQGGMTVAPTTLGGTGYAQGGARVTNIQGIGCTLVGGVCSINGALTYPVATQITNHLAANSNTFTARELVLVLAGGNDIFAQYASVGGGLAQATALTNLQAAATELANLVKNQILAKGAARVVVLKVPDVGSSPFGNSQGAGKALLTTMTTTFNDRLTADLATSTATVVDTFTQVNEVLTNPGTYGVSNVANPACSASAINTLTGGLITDGNSLFCSGNTLSVAGADTSYLFADGVHPTTKGHQLIADYVWSILQPLNWQQ